MYVCVCVFIEWQRINTVSGRKITTRSNLKAASQKERFQKWKEHFKNLF